MKTILKCNVFEKKLLNFCDFVSRELVDNPDSFVDSLYTNGTQLKNNVIRNIRNTGINNDLSDVLVLVNPQREIAVKSFIDPLLLKSLLEDENVEINQDNFFNFTLLIHSLYKWVDNKNEVRDSSLIKDVFENVTSRKYIYSEDFEVYNITEDRFNIDYISKYLYSTLVKSLHLDNICTDLFKCGVDISSKLISESKIGIVHATSVTSIIMSFVSLLNTVYENNNILISYGIDTFNFLNKLSYNVCLIPDRDKYFEYLITVGKLKQSDKDLIIKTVDKWIKILSISNIIQFANNKSLDSEYKYGMNSHIPVFELDKLESLNIKMNVINNYLDIYYENLLADPIDEIRNSTNSNSVFLLINSDNSFLSLYSTNNSRISNYFNSYTEFTDDKRVGTIVNSYSLMGISHLQFDGFRLPIKNALFRNPKLKKVVNPAFNNVFSDYDNILVKSLIDELGLDSTINFIPVLLDDLIASGKYELCHLNEFSIILVRELDNKDKFIDVSTYKWNFSNKLQTLSGVKYNAVWLPLIKLIKDKDSNNRFTVEIDKSNVNQLLSKIMVPLEVNKFINNDILTFINNKETKMLNEYINIYNMNNKEELINQPEVLINDVNSTIISKLDNSLTDFISDNLKSIINFLIRNYRDEFINLLLNDKLLNSILTSKAQGLLINNPNKLISYDDIFAENYTEEEANNIRIAINRCFSKLMFGHSKAITGLMPIPTYFREQYIKAVLKRIQKEGSAINKNFRIKRNFTYNSKNITDFLPFSGKDKCMMTVDIDINSSTIINLKQKLKSLLKIFLINCLKDLNSNNIISPTTYLNSNNLFEYTYNEYVNEYSNVLPDDGQNGDINILNYTLYCLGPKMLLDKSITKLDLDYIKSVNNDSLPYNLDDDAFISKISEVLKSDTNYNKFLSLRPITGHKNWITLIADYSVVTKAILSSFNISEELLELVFDSEFDNIIENVVAEFIVLLR